MLTVGNDAGKVERRLAAGRLECPDSGCSGRLVPWGWARVRVVRGPGGIRWRWQPRRARCGGCRRTHVLLPVAALVRRADGAVVIGAALLAKAAGWGHRPIAAWLGRPAATVRGWLRRFAERAEGLRAAFTALLVELSADPPVLVPVGSVVGDAVVAIVAAAQAVAGRLVVVVSAWELACAVTSGRLLEPVAG